MKPSTIQTSRAAPPRGRPKDAGVLISRRPDASSGESKIPKFAVKGAFEESSIDLVARSPEDKSTVEGLLGSAMSNLLVSVEAEVEDVPGSGEFDGGSPVLFPVKEEEEEKARDPMKAATEGASKAECPAAAAETPVTLNKIKALIRRGRSADSSYGSKGLRDTVVGEVGIGGVSPAVDGRSALTLAAKVRIGVVFFLVGWLVTVNILAVSAVLGGRGCGDSEVFSGLPPT